jgi:thioesterase domain-containing protein
MAQKRLPSRQTVERMRAREAAVGLDSDDEAAQWLATNDAPPPAASPKSLAKNKLLHQWRRRRP